MAHIPAARSGGTPWADLRRSLGEIQELARHNPGLTGFMRFRAEQAAGAPSERGAWVPLHGISPYLVCAVICSEDRTFFRHGGIWWSELWRQTRVAAKKRSGVRGVSTITQQLARNLYLHPERSMRRKLQEAILARRLERALTKERILELYFNLIEWGDGFWGVEAAAARYFGAKPAELNPVQAVMLASLIPAPRRPLRDQNALRAIGMQKRLTIDLYACGVLSYEEAGAVAGRVRALEQAIQRGEQAQEVFRRNEELAIEPTLRGRPEITTRSVIADQCGYERSQRLAALMRRCKKAGRRPDLPLWWTDEPSTAAGA